MSDIYSLPKVDLHCHLDGSMSSSTIKKIASHEGLTLPYDDLELKSRLQVSDDCRSLIEYLERFDLPLSYLGSLNAFRLAAFALMEEAAKENVMYLEIRFAPLLSSGAAMSPVEIVQEVIQGIRDAEDIFPIRGNVIICGMRNHSEEQNVRLLMELKSLLGRGICAIDIAGDETSYPPNTQKRFFELAKQLGVPFTIHAGECQSVSNVRDALDLGAKRIGHGIALEKDQELKERCVRDRIGIEMCPTSNLQTKAVNSLAEYPIVRFVQEGLLVSVNTDNRTVSNTSMTKELQLVKDNFGIEPKQLIQNAVETSFADEDTRKWMKDQLSVFQ